MSVDFTSLYLCLWLLGVCGVHSDETETISVTEGDSVTLNTEVTEVQRDDQILWMFGLHSSETRIAEIYKQITSIYDKENNERFRARLQIDEQTGSLTITDINKSHSGLYKLLIITGKVKQKSFNIVVYAPLTVPVIRDSLQNPSVSERSSSRCSVLCSAVNVSGVTLSWWKGISLLSSISVSDLSISLSLPLEIQCVDDSYSCVLSYPFTNRTTHLDITDLCQPCAGTRQHSFLTELVIVALLVVVIAGVVFMYCCRKKHKKAKQEAQSPEEEVSYNDVTFTPHRASDAETDRQDQTDQQDQTEYSRVVLR